MFEDLITDVISLLIPIGICVVLPIVIVWLFVKSSINESNNKAKILLKALETDNGVNTDKLAEAMAGRNRTPREILNRRLLFGCIMSFIGVASCIACAVMCAAGESLFNFPGFLLLLGAASIAIGLGFLVVYFVTRKQVEEHKE